MYVVLCLCVDVWISVVCRNTSMSMWAWLCVHLCGVHMCGPLGTHQQAISQGHLPETGMCGQPASAGLCLHECVTLYLAQERPFVFFML